MPTKLQNSNEIKKSHRFRLIAIAKLLGRMDSEVAKSRLKGLTRIEGIGKESLSDAIQGMVDTGVLTEEDLESIQQFSAEIVQTTSAWFPGQSLASPEKALETVDQDLEAEEFAAKFEAEPSQANSEHSPPSDSTTPVVDEPTIEADAAEPSSSNEDSLTEEITGETSVEIIEPASIAKVCQVDSPKGDLVDFPDEATAAKAEDSAEAPNPTLELELDRKAGIATEPDSGPALKADRAIQAEPALAPEPEAEPELPPALEAAEVADSEQGPETVSDPLIVSANTEQDSSEAETLAELPKVEELQEALAEARASKKSRRRRSKERRSDAGNSSKETGSKAKPKRVRVKPSDDYERVLAKSWEETWDSKMLRVARTTPSRIYQATINGSATAFDWCRDYPQFSLPAIAAGILLLFSPMLFNAFFGSSSNSKQQLARNSSSNSNQLSERNQAIATLAEENSNSAPTATVQPNVEESDQQLAGTDSQETTQQSESGQESKAKLQDASLSLSPGAASLESAMAARARIANSESTIETPPDSTTTPLAETASSLEVSSSSDADNLDRLITKVRDLHRRKMFPEALQLLDNNFAQSPELAEQLDHQLLRAALLLTLKEDPARNEAFGILCRYIDVGSGNWRLVFTSWLLASEPGNRSTMMGLLASQDNKEGQFPVSRLRMWLAIRFKDWGASRGLEPLRPEQLEIGDLTMRAIARLQLGKKGKAFEDTQQVVQRLEAYAPTMSPLDILIQDLCGLRIKSSAQKVADRARPSA